MKFYWTLRPLPGIHMALLGGRTHHPDIPIGIWRQAVNGIQFFVGPFGLSICWCFRKKAVAAN